MRLTPHFVRHSQPSMLSTKKCFLILKSLLRGLGSHRLGVRSDTFYVSLMIQI